MTKEQSGDSLYPDLMYRENNKKQMSEQQDADIRWMLEHGYIAQDIALIIGCSLARTRNYIRTHRLAKTRKLNQ